VRPPPADVVVVGAGPTGLALALQAHAFGAKVRLVERRARRNRPSRALIVHPRTLEALRPLGVADTLVERGDPSPTARLHLAGGVVDARLDGLDLPDTAFPHLLLIRQADVEAVLSDALTSHGVEIERGHEVVCVEPSVDGVQVLVRAAGGESRIESRYVVGCDGPDSIVRSAAGIDWRGAPHRQEVVLADVELAGDLGPGAVHAVPAPGGLVFLFSPGEHATWRLLATRTSPAGRGGLPFGQPGPAVPQDELQAVLDGSGLAVTVTDVAWSAQVPLQHRLARHYRAGRLFIAGDAAHAQSPAGGLGMNHGIHDATNLGWKLALAVRSGRADVDLRPLLDSYEAERRPMARRMVAMNRAIFWAEAGTDVVASLLRRAVRAAGARPLPAILRQRRLVAVGASTVSQLRAPYRRSPISADEPRGGPLPPPGSRLADAPITTDAGRGRLHALLASPTTGVLLQRDAAAPEAPIGEHVRVHRLLDRPGAGILAVRPDGYVGFRSATGDHAALLGWLDRIGAGSVDRAAAPRAPMASIPPGGPDEGPALEGPRGPVAIGGAARSCPRERTAKRRSAVSLPSSTLAPPIEHVVICTDGRPLGPETTVASVIARRTGARLHVAHVSGGTSPDDAAIDDAVTRAAAEVGADADLLKAAHGASPATAARLIAHLAGLPSALACLATHGRNPVAELALGSVTAEVVRDGRMPVLACGPDAVPCDDLTRVVACTDGSSLAAEVLPAAGGLARDLGVPLWVVQVVEEGAAAGEDVTESAMVHRLVEGIARNGIDLEWDVLHGRHPAAAINDYVNAQQGAVTALATHGRSGLRGTMMGSVAKQVVRHARGPVLVYRPLSEPEVDGVSARDDGRSRR
jgi:2-polyprenyl-6-methoxyphenol hydroxylase-like FAD-dependent oxidoreductase/nucleotide-binding universal stress UspA family protein